MYHNVSMYIYIYTYILLKSTDLTLGPKNLAPRWTWPFQHSQGHGDPKHGAKFPPPKVTRQRSVQGEEILNVSTTLNIVAG